MAEIGTKAMELEKERARGKVSKAEYEQRYRAIYETDERRVDVQWTEKDKEAEQNKNNN